MPHAVYKIVTTKRVPRGKLFLIDVMGKRVKILFTTHALNRIKRWGITVGRAVETLLFPEEVLSGHRNRFIAHKRYRNHITRAIYEYDKDLPVVVTVYFPYSRKYFEGGRTYEDKILS